MRQAMPSTTSTVANAPSLQDSGIKSRQRRRRGRAAGAGALIMASTLLLLAPPAPTTAHPFGTGEAGMDTSVRSSLHAALASYQQQQEGGGTQAPTTIARSKLLEDHVFHGTTTCAFVFDQGILVAVDSRASMGSYIGSSATEKVLPVSRHILATMAGGAADCAFWIRHLAMQARLYEVENEGQQLTVKRASKLLANNIARYLGKLSMGTMVLGHDPQDGFSIYYVDNDGTRSKGKLFAVGSGSTYAYSILDAGYRPGMSVEEAKELGLRAIRHATYRDAFSGGFVNIYLVQASGWRRIARVDGGFLSLPPLGAGEDGGARKEKAG